MEKRKSCTNCHGMGQIELGSSGPADCPACKGNGYIKIIEKVDHYDKAKNEVKQD